jgi:glutamine amidotransferase
VYRRADGEQPECARFPGPGDPGHDRSDETLEAAASLTGRIFNVHVRRATVGGATGPNTHPFCLGNYSFSHSGTIAKPHKLAEHASEHPAGDTDSELLFNHVMHEYDPARPVECLRSTVEAVIAASPFSALNFLFSDGERLYAYRLGMHELHWLGRDDRLLVASERLTDDERWHSVQQDVLLVLDPRNPDEPHAERLVGDAAVGRADMRDITPRGAAASRPAAIATE